MTGLDPKSELRVRLRRRRRALKARSPDAAVMAAKAFCGWCGPTFSTAAVYLAHGAEIDAEPLAQLLSRGGVAIALPAVVSLDVPLAFRLRAGESLVPDVIGMLAPPAEAPSVRPDLVVTPLLAFDAAGGRLGQGGGFYDRTLEALRRTGEVFALGLGYAGQEIETVPAGPYDQPLDGVLTESGLRMFNDGA